MDRLIAIIGTALMSIAGTMAYVATYGLPASLTVSQAAAETTAPDGQPLGTNGFNGGDPNGSETVAPTPTQPAFFPPTIRDRVTPIILAGDVDKVETFYKAYSGVPEDARLDYVAQRTLFSLFETSGPEAGKTLDDWLARYPASPHAMTARGWRLVHLGFLMRGADLPRYTHSEALDKAETYFREAADLAEKAHAADPALIAATDLMIVSAAPLGRVDVPEKVVAEVMARQPNRGTLLRAAGALAPQWLGRGSTAAIDQLCAAYAAQVPNVVNYTTDVCRADLYNAGNLRPDKLAPVAGIVRSSKSWTLAKERALLAIAEVDKTDRGRAAIEGYLFDQTVDDTDAAAFLDGVFYKPARRPLVGYDVAVRRMQAGLDAMRLDPFDLRNIEKAASTVYGEIGQPLRPIHGGLEIDGYRKALKDALQAAPFDSRIWVKLGSALDMDDLGGFAGAMPFFVNAVAYSNQSPYYAAEIVNHARSFGYQDRMDDKSLCTVIRAIRVFEAQCGAGSTDYPCFSQDTGSVRSELLGRATNEGLCQSELSASPEELAFAPVEIKWSRYKLDD